LDDRDLLKVVREVIGREHTLDDCAVMRLGDKFLVATTDMLHSVTDFPAPMSNWQIGWMCAAVSFSDIASMGACPWFLLLAVGLDRPERLWEIMSGAYDCCSRFGAELVGGDLDRHDELTLVSTGIGIVEPELIVRRSGSGMGDLICVTGTLGCAGAALVGYHQYDLQLFEPRPRVAEGRKLATSGVTSMMDVSDGLALSLYDMLEANTCGYSVRSALVPVPAGIPYKIGRDLSLYSGGDYELLFTCPPARLPDIDIPFTVIGKIVPEHGVWLDDQVMEKKGYVHRWQV
jgi:thiamine-monophosphate kinase